MSLECPSCQSPLNIKQIKIINTLATCNFCKSRFKIDPSTIPLASVDGISISYSDDEFIIDRSWYHEDVNLDLYRGLGLIALIIIFFFLIHTGIYSSVYLKFLSHILVVVGMAYIYFLLSISFNKTRYSVSNLFLTVDHSPFPAMGSCKIPRNKIKKLYIEKVNRYASKSIVYELILESDGFSHVNIAPRARDYQQLQKIEQELSSILGIAKKLEDVSYFH